MPGLMPTTKTWTSKDGVTIEYITYRTVLMNRVRDAIVTAGQMPTEQEWSFILPAATTTNITLPAEDPPIWGQILHGLVKGGSFLKSPLADYQSLAYAPEELIENWLQGFVETRDQTHAAPEPLKNAAPLPPDVGTGEEGPQDESHPTSSDAPSLSVLSSTSSGRPPRGKAKTAI
jgi:hypothetical protein